MVWQQWAYLTITTIGILGFVSAIGEERQPISPKRAIPVLVLAFIELWLVLSIGG